MCRTAQWFVDGSLAAGTTTTLETFLPLGTHQLEVAVFDNDGALATASATVDVIDTTPPVLSFDTLCLWPPNHKLYAIDAADLHVIDACDPNATVKFVSGSSDQPDDGTGDGNTDDDLVVKPDSVCARAERDGGVATGRTYTITAIATDGATNQGQLTFEIVVPHNHSTTCVSGGEAVDDSDPRCIPSPAIAPEQAIAAATLPVAEESHAGSGCDAGGRAQGIGLVLVLVAPLPLRRRRRRQAE